MDIMTLKLDQIVPDPGLQPRVEGLDPDHVKELEAVAEHVPPIKVVRHGDRFLLVDGFHRYAAAQNLKHTAIAATIIDVPDGEDLHSLAFALNAAHGKPLTLTDRRAFAGRMLRSHPEWSDREIGRRCGLVQPTIAKVRQELEQRSDIRSTDVRIGRDGRSYPVQQQSAAAGNDLMTTLSDTLSNIFTPAERRGQRRLVRYLEQLAQLLEQQDSLPNFETIDQAADACRAVLGSNAAKELADRLGWSAVNVIEIARSLGYRQEQS